MDAKDLDKKLKNVILQYLNLYDTNILRIEIDVRKEPESVKLKISQYKNI